MNENTVTSHSKYVFLIALAIAGLVSLLLMDISYFLGIIVGYIVSLIIFQIIIKMSDLILAISSNTISLVIILFLTKLLIYGLGFFIAIKVSWINIITVFLGYFIIKITIYIDTYRQDRLDKIKNN
ncbi:hypothetical protein [Thomasclavelia spiroformis]|uniref:hypothetical protein n=1 Tax=Thomasclavelia spiroformis TaxID=29348 RepID=UPI000B391EE1|nr:hypothetical protein [Thomasclavelia spiroformis]MBS6684894.1 hypothetical protein [Thomasclavelia spiroformis]OUO67353.1 hypothetical protein B5F64_10860 [Thomasclavelia spiroformis]